MSTLDPSKRLYNGCLLTFAFVILESKGVDSQTIRESVKHSPQSANTIYMTHILQYVLIVKLQYTRRVYHPHSLSFCYDIILRLEHLKKSSTDPTCNPSPKPNKRTAILTNHESTLQRQSAVWHLHLSKCRKFWAVSKCRRLEQVDSSKQIANFIKCHQKTSNRWQSLMKRWGWFENGWFVWLTTPIMIIWFMTELAKNKIMRNYIITKNS